MGKDNFDPKLIFGKEKIFSKQCNQNTLLRLVGLEDTKERLKNDIDLLFNPSRSVDWSKKYYQTKIFALSLLNDLVPLIIFEGDVGTGKTALAESIGSLVAKNFDYDIQLLKMSTQVRGKGFVGQMGSLLSESFRFVESQAQKKSCPTLLVIDEADSILTSRESSGQHHEDKAGVNTILQHLDNLKKTSIPIVVIAITNRFDVLDPAIKRRTAAIYTFKRPTDKLRKDFFKKYLNDVRFSDKDFDELVRATNEQDINGIRIPYSYADLGLRILLPSIRSAIQKDQGIKIQDILDNIKITNPSPQIKAYKSYETTQKT